MSTKIREVAKKVNKMFEITKRMLFKADTINLLQFLVHQVWCSPAQTWRSNAPGSAPQCGRASGVVDGNFPCWAE